MSLSQAPKHKIFLTEYTIPSTQVKDQYLRSKSWKSYIYRHYGDWHVPVESRIFSFPRYPDRLWGPSNLIYNGYRGLYPRG
jgi:hypothetical protein